MKAPGRKRIPEGFLDHEGGEPGSHHDRSADRQVTRRLENEKGHGEWRTDHTGGERRHPDHRGKLQVDLRGKAGYGQQQAEEPAQQRSHEQRRKEQPAAEPGPQ